MKSTLDLALEYLEEYHFSIIPVNPAVEKRDGAKVPLIKEIVPYRSKLPTREEVIQWWNRWPNAMIATYVGKLNGIMAIDADNQEAIDKLNELLPDSFHCPTVKTPRNDVSKHFYFQYRDDLANLVEPFEVRVRDLLIVLPGSVRADGRKYELLNGCNLKEVPELPASIFNYLFSFCSKGGAGGRESPVENVDYLFGENLKDHGLFHTSLCLARGGMKYEHAEQVIKIIQESWGEGHLDKWRKDKLDSAFKRVERGEKSLTDEVREEIMSTTGDFLSTDVHKNLGLSTRVHKKTVSTILARFCKEGLIEKSGKKNGSWRKIDRSFDEQCWWEAKGSPLPLRFPLNIEKYAKVFPGNVILLEGQKSQGKSAFALEFCRMNRKIFKDKILYQNVEMSDDELLDRFKAYGDVMSPEEWRESVTFIRQSGEWWDKINPDGLNVIDYLLEYKESFLIAEFVWNIHKKLKSGIALVVVQRDPLKPYPAGGRGVRDIPRLIMSLIHHKIKLEDVKSFHVEHGNPTGMVRRYKQANWWNFVPVDEWKNQDDDKYKEFERGGEQL